MKPEPHPSPFFLKTSFLLAALMVAVAAVYWPGLGGGFAFDDYPNIVFNSALRVSSLDRQAWLAAVFSSQAGDLQRPLAMFSFALNHYFSGMDPLPMKATNVAIHVLNAGLVFGLVRSLLRVAVPAKTGSNQDKLALFASASWALLPINLMAVLLVVQRMESLSHTFVFAGLWLYVIGRTRQQEGRPGWKYVLIGLLLCTGVGALSKESAVLLPLYAFFLEVFLLKFRGNAGTRQPCLTGLYVVTLAIPAVAGFLFLLTRALPPGAFARRNFTLIERLLTEPRVVVDYIYWTLAPNLNQLSLFHDDYVVSRGILNPPATLFAMVALAALAALAWWIRKSRPLTSLGLAWFLGAQALTATVVPLELVFEHRNYFASLGLMLALTDLLLIAPAATNLRRAGVGLAALLLIFYAASTHLRALDWQHPLMFAKTEAEKHPQSPRATYQLAQTLAILSDGDPTSPYAATAFEAFEKAMQVPGANILPAQGALLLAARTGAPFKETWWTDMQDRLRERPIGPQDLGALGALTDCAIVKRCPFPPDEMLRTYASVLSQGDNPEVMNIFANYVLNVLDDVALAEFLWTRAIELNPREAQYVINLTKLLIATQRPEQARAQIAVLRGMGRFGQYGAVADALEARMSAEPPSARKALP